MTTQGAITTASGSISRRDAQTLLLHVLQRERAWLRAYPETELTETEASRFLALTQRRAAHTPLQYLTGRQEFFGLDLRVDEHVLIPRPETELLVEAVLLWHAEHDFRATRIVDVGTGSGAIALALAAHLASAAITAVDLSPAALTVAAANADRLGFGERIRFAASDLLAGVAQDQAGFDVIVSNPPYVPRRDAPEMQPEVRDFEPHLALFAGEDGLAVYRRLIPQAHHALRPGGLLALEIGFGQKQALAALLSGWESVHFQEDYAGIPRVVLAVRP